MKVDDINSKNNQSVTEKPSCFLRDSLNVFDIAHPKKMFSKNNIFPNDYKDVNRKTRHY